MQIDRLHITNIYEGLLACSNIRRYNERFLSNLDEHVYRYLPSHAPLHTIIPPEAPNKLPCCMVAILLDGTPKGRENECDENGDFYNGHWLGVVSFIDEPSIEQIEMSIEQAKALFDSVAQGYFF